MNSTTSIPTNAVSVLQFADACLYKFNNKDRTQIAEGPCDIFTSQTNDQTPTQQSFIYLKIKQSLQTLTRSQVFVKIQYAGSYCLLYQNADLENFCLSVQKHNLQSDQELIKFAQNFTVIDYNSELLEDRQRQSILLHYSANVQKQDIGYDTKRGLKRVSRNIGLLSGKASNLIHSPIVSNSVQSLGNRVSHISEQYVNENTWNSIKQKASIVNDQMTKIVRPVMNVIDNISSSIGKSFSTSENNYIKGIRQYSYAICDSLNEGERKGRINNEQLQNHQISKIELKQGN